MQPAGRLRDPALWKTLAAACIMTPHGRYIGLRVDFIEREAGIASPHGATSALRPDPSPRRARITVSNGRVIASERPLIMVRTGSSGQQGSFTVPHAFRKWRPGSVIGSRACIMGLRGGTLGLGESNIAMCGRISGLHGGIASREARFLTLRVSAFVVDEGIVGMSACFFPHGASFIEL